ncbi:chorismate synthase [Candidatus Micrarchaeota archaeon CG11_big_fil_rev_8_21_14_0_20_47_5]|nr:MAG: hypothetical protein AUJ17_05390 [Candidatus Micrarchaeota archaeon CG1_02_47_40]PIN83510.1 MAG: chorismate synthase [Candidatus Micrarchaeota archaeon CG11_big_fil_rev_8_21_14_0_20_47_5]
MPLGKNYRISLFGESHGKCIGVLIEGCPPGVQINEGEIQKELEKRRPGASRLATGRNEKDGMEFLSGIFQGRASGAPICAIIRNEDVDSSPYKKIKDTPRPSHADYTAHVRYKGFNDYRGGGIFSGRLTAGWMVAGALAKKMLFEKGISIASEIIRVGGSREKREFAFIIQEAKEKGDSVSGEVFCRIEGVPAGIGTPHFGALDALLAHAMFCIPAVKGVEFGSTKNYGSQNNDAYYFDAKGNVRARPNNSGGILGGISTGMPIEFTVKIKPTASIAIEQDTVNLKTKKNAKIKIEGRHDACIALRAAPVVGAAAACVILDGMLAEGKIKAGKRGQKHGKS